MWYTVAMVLVVAWVLGFGFLQVAGGLIHLLLVLAVISVLFTIRGRRPAG